MSHVKPTNFTYGVTNAITSGLMADYPSPLPFRLQDRVVAEYFEDFMYGGASNFTVTGASSTFANTDGEGGLAILTPGGATTASSAYRTNTIVKFVSGQDSWFGARFQLSALTGVAAKVGLQAGSSTNDGLYFVKASGSAAVKLTSEVGGVATDLLTGLGTLVAATYMDVGWHYNGTDLEVFVGGVKVGRVSNVTIGASGTNLTNVALGPVVQITPASSETLTVDYLIACEIINR